LCANIVLKEFIQAYDGDLFEEYVWIDRKKLLNEVWPRFRALRELKQLGAQVVLHSTRDPYMGDCLVRATCAGERIGRESPQNPLAGPGEPKNYQTTAGDFFYTRLIRDDHYVTFAFYRDRAFFSAVLPGIKMPENTRLTPIKVPLPEITEPFAVFMPGASEKFREWPPERFAEVARHLYKTRGLRGVILGSAADRTKGAAMQQAAPEIPWENLCGQLTLAQVVGLISRCAAGLTNDSGGIHILAALDRPGVAISNCFSFGWFHPYPKEVSTAVSYIYPEAFYASPLSWNERKEIYGRTKYLSITDVSIQPVLDRLDAVLDRRPYDDPIQKMCDERPERPLFS
jgi:ADP-heptose:LPS heptosyltransferase